MPTLRNSTESTQTEDREAQLFEELERTRQELNDFVYIVSHDLKAPLRGIESLAGWLATDYADKLDEDGQELIDLLVNRVKRMRNLLDGLLQYSRIGRLTEEKETVNLNELAQDIIEKIAPPDTIKITIVHELPSIWAERAWLEQVFKNLLSNAVIYMDKPQGKIEIRCIETDDYWRFMVVDNGPGIEETHFDRIFQIFQTLQPRDEFDSSGVGLSLVKKIVELYGGKIWPESTVGAGSSFHFTLSKQETSIKK